MSQANSQRPLTVLHTEWSSGWGGQEIRILAESEAFRKRGFRMLIAAQPGSTLLQRATDAGLETFCVPMHKGFDIGAIRHFMRLIRENGVDLVHSHSSVDHRLAGIAAKLTGHPLVRSRHLSTPISRSPFSKALYTWLAGRVITSGAFIRDAMVNWNGMPPAQIVSIPAGIDEAQFSLARDLPDARAEFGIAPDTFVVGIVAVLRSWKGHDDLIAAVDLVRGQIPGVKLLIVGDGVRRPAIEQLISERNLQDTVILAGHRKDPAPYFKAMDVVVLPSYSNEATSQVLPQALAMQRAVISTDIGGLPEVVEHEKTGLLVPARQPQAIADAILRLYRDRGLMQRMGEAGQARVLEKFTFKKMIDDTESVYRSLL